MNFVVKIYRNPMWSFREEVESISGRTDGGRMDGRMDDAPSHKLPGSTFRLARSSRGECEKADVEECGVHPCVESHQNLIQALQKKIEENSQQVQNLIKREDLCRRLKLLSDEQMNLEEEKGMVLPEACECHETGVQVNITQPCAEAAVQTGVNGDLGEISVFSRVDCSSYISDPKAADEVCSTVHKVMNKASPLISALSGSGSNIYSGMCEHIGEAHVKHLRHCNGGVTKARTMREGKFGDQLDSSSSTKSPKQVIRAIDNLNASQDSVSVQGEGGYIASQADLNAKYTKGVDLEGSRCKILESDDDSCPNGCQSRVEKLSTSLLPVLKRQDDFVKVMPRLEKTPNQVEDSPTAELTPHHVVNTVMASMPRSLTKDPAKAALQPGMGVPAEAVFAEGPTKPSWSCATNLKHIHNAFQGQALDAKYNIPQRWLNEKPSHPFASPMKPNGRMMRRTCSEDCLLTVSSAYVKNMKSPTTSRECDVINHQSELMHLGGERVLTKEYKQLQSCDAQQRFDSKVNHTTKRKCKAPLIPSINPKMKPVKRKEKCIQMPLKPLHFPSSRNQMATHSWCNDEDRNGCDVKTNVELAVVDRDPSLPTTTVADFSYRQPFVVENLHKNSNDDFQNEHLLNNTLCSDVLKMTTFELEPRDHCHWSQQDPDVPQKPTFCASGGMNAELVGEHFVENPLEQSNLNYHSISVDKETDPAGSWCAQDTPVQGQGFIPVEYSPQPCAMAGKLSQRCCNFPADICNMNCYTSGLDAQDSVDTSDASSNDDQFSVDSLILKCRNMLDDTMCIEKLSDDMSDDSLMESDKEYDDIGSIPKQRSLSLPSLLNGTWKCANFEFSPWESIFDQKEDVPVEFHWTNSTLSTENAFTFNSISRGKECQDEVLSCGTDGYDRVAPAVPKVMNSKNVSSQKAFHSSLASLSSLAESAQSTSCCINKSSCKFHKKFQNWQQKLDQASNGVQCNITASVEPDRSFHPQCKLCHHADETKNICLLSQEKALLCVPAEEGHSLPTQIHPVMWNEKAANSFTTEENSKGIFTWQDEKLDSKNGENEHKLCQTHWVDYASKDSGYSSSETLLEVADSSETSSVNSCAEPDSQRSLENHIVRLCTHPDIYFPRHCIKRTICPAETVFIDEPCATCNTRSSCKLHRGECLKIDADQYNEKQQNETLSFQSAEHHFLEYLSNDVNSESLGHDEDRCSFESAEEDIDCKLGSADNSTPFLSKVSVKGLNSDVFISRRGKTDHESISKEKYQQLTTGAKTPNLPSLTMDCLDVETSNLSPKASNDFLAGNSNESEIAKPKETCEQLVNCGFLSNEDEVELDAHHTFILCSDASVRTQHFRPKTNMCQENCARADILSQCYIVHPLLNRSNKESILPLLDIPNVNLKLLSRSDEGGFVGEKYPHSLDNLEALKANHMPDCTSGKTNCRATNTAQECTLKQETSKSLLDVLRSAEDLRKQEQHPHEIESNVCISCDMTRNVIKFSQARAAQIALGDAENGRSREMASCQISHEQMLQDSEGQRSQNTLELLKAKNDDESFHPCETLQNPHNQLDYHTGAKSCTSVMPSNKNRCGGIEPHLETYLIDCGRLERDCETCSSADSEVENHTEQEINTLGLGKNLIIKKEEIQSWSTVNRQLGSNKCLLNASNMKEISCTGQCGELTESANVKKLFFTDTSFAKTETSGSLISQKEAYVDHLQSSCNDASYSRIDEKILQQSHCGQSGDIDHVRNVADVEAKHHQNMHSGTIDSASLTLLTPQIKITRLLNEEDSGGDHFNAVQEEKNADIDDTHLTSTEWSRRRLLATKKHTEPNLPSTYFTENSGVDFTSAFCYDSTSEQEMIIPQETAWLILPKEGRTNIKQQQNVQNYDGIATNEMVVQNGNDSVSSVCVPRQASTSFGPHECLEHASLPSNPKRHNEGKEYTGINKRENEDDVMKTDATGPFQEQPWLVKSKSSLPDAKADQNIILANTNHWAITNEIISATLQHVVSPEVLVDLSCVPASANVDETKSPDQETLVTPCQRRWISSDMETVTKNHSEAEVTVNGKSVLENQIALVVENGCIRDVCNEYLSMENSDIDALACYDSQNGHGEKQIITGLKVEAMNASKTLFSKITASENANLEVSVTNVRQIMEKQSSGIPEEQINCVCTQRLKTPVSQADASFEVYIGMDSIKQTSFGYVEDQKKVPASGECEYTTMSSATCDDSDMSFRIAKETNKQTLTASNLPGCTNCQADGNVVMSFSRAIDADDHCLDCKSSCDEAADTTKGLFECNRDFIKHTCASNRRTNDKTLAQAISNLISNTVTLESCHKHNNQVVSVFEECGGMSAPLAYCQNDTFHTISNKPSESCGSIQPCNIAISYISSGGNPHHLKQGSTSCPTCNDNGLNCSGVPLCSQLCVNSSSKPVFMTTQNVEEMGILSFSPFRETTERQPIKDSHDCGFIHTLASNDITEDVGQISATGCLANRLEGCEKIEHNLPCQVAITLRSTTSSNVEGACKRGLQSCELKESCGLSISSQKESFFSPASWQSHFSQQHLLSLQNLPQDASQMINAMEILENATHPQSNLCHPVQNFGASTVDCNLSSCTLKVPDSKVCTTGLKIQTNCKNATAVEMKGEKLEGESFNMESSYTQEHKSEHEFQSKLSTSPCVNVQSDLTCGTFGDYLQHLPRMSESIAMLTKQKLMVGASLYLPHSSRSSSGGTDSECGIQDAVTAQICNTCIAPHTGLWKEFPTLFQSRCFDCGANLRLQSTPSLPLRKMELYFSDCDQHVSSYIKGFKCTMLVDCILMDQISRHSSADIPWHPQLKKHCHFQNIDLPEEMPLNLHWFLKNCRSDLGVMFHKNHSQSIWSNGTPSEMHHSIEPPCKLFHKEATCFVANHAQESIFGGWTEVQSFALGVNSDKAIEFLVKDSSESQDENLNDCCIPIKPTPLVNEKHFLPVARQGGCPLSVVHCGCGISWKTTPNFHKSSEIPCSHANNDAHYSARSECSKKSSPHAFWTSRQQDLHSHQNETQHGGKINIPPSKDTRLGPALLSLALCKPSLSIELSEAKLNYGLGQTDALLRSLDEEGLVEVRRSSPRSLHSNKAGAVEVRRYRRSRSLSPHVSTRRIQTNALANATESASLSSSSSELHCITAANWRNKTPQVKVPLMTKLV
uniref:Uncharacterized protein n=1 Tax=Eptatretus burgeri TaxID=7764 RepID=A0A8C4N4E0_EPTBU